MKPKAQVIYRNLSELRELPGNPRTIKKDLFDKLDACFHFTLDPCATDENHKAPKYFTRAQDGLKQDWGGLYGAIHPMAEKSEAGSRNAQSIMEWPSC